KGEDARAQIMFMRANSFFYANRFDEAEKIYRDITDKFPNTEIGLKSRLNSCWTLYRSENYKECLSRVDSYLKETNESRDEALYVKAKTLAKLGRGNEASNIYRLIIDKYRDSGFRKESLYEVGWLYDDTLGKPGEAVRYYIEFANDYQNDPRSAEMLLKAGQESFELKQYKNAETVYNLFLSRYPDSPLKENALYQLGAVYLGMGDYDNAVKAYEKFLVEFPGSTVRDSTIYWIARSYQGRQDWDKAVEYYSKLAGEKGGRFSDIATEAIGFCFFQKGDYDKAARVYKDLITGAKEYKLPSSVYRWVADYYLNGEEYDTSLLVLETYTKRYPGMGDNGEIFYLIAENYAGLENWREAAKNFRKALDGGVGSPYLERSYLGLGRSMAATGEHEEALEMLEMALSGHKDTLTGALARFEIGNVKNSLEDYEGAAKSFMMVAILYDDEDLVSRALFLAGMAFRKAGMPDKSKEAFEELIKKYPNSPLSVKAQAEIKKAESETR
ncbi:MAG: tetratricopeptide repeat protein, partial [Candidatus Omnitrophota bacterium]